jgi:hypothetical protein
MELQRKILLMFSIASLSSCNLRSLRKIMSVHKAVMAISLASCLSQLVDILRELQFCMAKVISGILRCRGEEDHLPWGGDGHKPEIELGEVLHVIFCGQVNQLGRIKDVKGNYLP